MTRIIKFRIREKGHISLNDALHVQLYPLEKGVTASTLTIYPGDIVEEYTGLKDKNGKEIYEGDVIKSTLGGVVEFSQGMFQVNQHDLFLHAQNGYEVVGNIYENPEMLNESN